MPIETLTLVGCYTRYGRPIPDGIGSMNEAKREATMCRRVSTT